MWYLQKKDFKHNKLTYKKYYFKQNKLIISYVEREWSIAWENINMEKNHKENLTLTDTKTHFKNFTI